MVSRTIDFITLHSCWTLIKIWTCSVAGLSIVKDKTEQLEMSSCLFIMAALMQRLSIEFAQGICSISHHGSDSSQSSSLQCQQRWLRQAAGKHKQTVEERIFDVIHLCHSWASRTSTSFNSLWHFLLLLTYFDKLTACEPHWEKSNERI